VLWRLQTINVIEESRLVDVELLGLYAMLLVALAAAGASWRCERGAAGAVFLSI
jgi:hypothetical protein